MARDRVNQLYTLGHSNHAFEHFLALLRRHAVATVADVRSRPFSRFVPHFTKDRLERALADEGIGYLYLGRELGGKPVKDDPPVTRLDYAARVERPAFQAGIARLLGAAGERRVAMICRERDPLDCHQEFAPFWEFVTGPLNAGTFGPNQLDNTFGPEVRFVKAPAAGEINLPPSAGLQFFGEVDIDGASEVMTVAPEGPCRRHAVHPGTRARAPVRRRHHGRRCHLGHGRDAVIDPAR